MFDAAREGARMAAARRQREAAAPPADLRPTIEAMERNLTCALQRIAEQAVPMVRAANLARIAALRQPPAAARAQIEAATQSFRRYANG
jgi:hypothetical protein